MTPAAEVARVEALCSASIHSMDCRARWPRIESVCDATGVEDAAGAGARTDFVLGSRVLCTDPNRCVCTLVTGGSPEPELRCLAMAAIGVRRDIDN